MIRNLKVTIAYKGTNYHGWQIQDNAYTVEEEIEKRASAICNEKIIAEGCSRTDTGVHALGYVFTMKTNSPIPTKNFIRAMNTLLPNDISVLSCEEVNMDFHARFSTVAKEYLYRIYCNDTKNPFESDLALHYKRQLDLNAMKRAAEHMIGRHDFAAFCTDSIKRNSTVRTIYEISINKSESFVEVLVKGDGFLYNMVRIIVGTLITVSEGRISPEDIDGIIEKKDRKLAGFTARPYGLYLKKVYY